MNSGKYVESIEKIELLLKSLRSVLNGIKNGAVNQKDIDNIKESLFAIKANARSCL
ncbi:ECU04_1635 [Encephalitozoon cuniculi GB-M1]|uniref:ECU04_1635 protein n=1 Tax=Encephalitozoon cuniculi (strain GB-M1) TaxID=284813 RepID=A0A1T5PD63_ENCCU|nr:uncharacterized protein ECU04_1635 [Encephalitozoon cuniculi GB-M1]SKD10695.1 ECU04_1635 [Encephalitozoon cuniculi GB-M1]